MRKIVVVEGKPFPDGRLINQGALRPSDRAFIPVMYRSFEGEIIARANDFQRDKETGEISFDIHYADKSYEDFHDDLEAHVFITPLSTEMDKNGYQIKIVNEGIIRGISLTLFGGHPAVRKIDGKVI